MIMEPTSANRLRFGLRWQSEAPTPLFHRHPVVLKSPTVPALVNFDPLVLGISLDVGAWTLGALPTPFVISFPLLDFCQNCSTMLTL